VREEGGGRRRRRRRSDRTGQLITTELERKKTTRIGD